MDKLPSLATDSHPYTSTNGRRLCLQKTYVRWSAHARRTKFISNALDASGDGVARTSLVRTNSGKTSGGCKGENGNSLGYLFSPFPLCLAKQFPHLGQVRFAPTENCNKWDSGQVGIAAELQTGGTQYRLKSWSDSMVSIYH